MTRVLLYASAAVVLGAFGFAVAARAPSAALLDTTTDTTMTTTAPTTTAISVTTAPVTTTPPTTVAPPPTTTSKPKVKTKPRRQTTTRQQTTTAQTTTPATTTQATTGTTTRVAAKKRERRRVTPLAVAAPTGGDTFPAWAIVGFCLAALLIGGGVTGMAVTRGRR